MLLAYDLVVYYDFVIHHFLFLIHDFVIQDFNFHASDAGVK